MLSVCYWKLDIQSLCLIVSYAFNFNGNVINASESPRRPKSKILKRLHDPNRNDIHVFVVKLLIARGVRVIVLYKEACRRANNQKAVSYLWR